MTFKFKNRVSEAIKNAPLNKTYRGGRPKKIDHTMFIELYHQYINRSIPSKTKLAEALNISRPTLDKLIKELIK